MGWELNLLTMIGGLPSILLSMMKDLRQRIREMVVCDF